MRGFGQFLFSIVSAALCGCMGAAYHPGAPIAQPKQTLVGREYPGAFEAVQRVDVKVVGREFQFTAYLQVDREHGLYGVALGEMGIKIFELRRVNGTAEIMRKPKNMPLNPMLGVVEDLWHLYGAGKNPEWICREGLKVAAVAEHFGADGLGEYQYNEAGQLTRSLRVANGRIASEATYDAMKTFAGYGAPLPEIVNISNRRWRTSMSIRLLSIKPLAASQATLGRGAS